MAVKKTTDMALTNTLFIKTPSRVLLKEYYEIEQHIPCQNPLFKCKCDQAVLSIVKKKPVTPRILGNRLIICAAGIPIEEQETRDPPALLAGRSNQILNKHPPFVPLHLLLSLYGRRSVRMLFTKNQFPGPLDFSVLGAALIMSFNPVI